MTHHDDWLDAAPVTLSAPQWASMSPQQRRLRNLQNQTRVHYLHSLHEQRYGSPALRLVMLDDELASDRREHPGDGSRRNRWR